MPVQRDGLATVAEHLRRARLLIGARMYVTYRSRAGVPVIASRFSYTPLAHYVDDEAVCAECEPSLEYSDAVPITRLTECDTPMHCVRCNALIACRLTDYGREYVRDEHELARSAVTKTWMEVFGLEVRRRA